jgi:alanyl-tRNA synthetase
MHRLVPALVTEMGAAYPELGRAQALIQEVLEREETKFRQTLDKGLKLLDEATDGLGEGGTLAGETAFKLYDTYGFPYDLTEDALRSRGISVDKDGFDAAMAQQKAAARAAWKGSGEAAAGKFGSILPNASARPNLPVTPAPPAKRRSCPSSRMARKSKAPARAMP